MGKTEIPDKAILAFHAIKVFSMYLLIPAGGITFLPDELLSTMRLLEIKNSFGLWISLIFLVSLSIVVIDIFKYFISIVKNKIISKRQYNNYINSLLILTQTEKEIIKTLFYEDRANLPLNDGSVNKLERLNIIMRSNVGTYFFNFSYTLQPWVLSYLRQHPEYFNLEISEEKLI